MKWFRIICWLTKHRFRVIGDGGMYEALECKTCGDVKDLERCYTIKE